MRRTRRPPSAAASASTTTFCMTTSERRKLLLSSSRLRTRTSERLWPAASSEPAVFRPTSPSQPWLSRKLLLQRMCPTSSLPYSEQYTLGVERVFLKNYTAEVRYVGTRGIHLDVQSQIDKQLRRPPRPISFPRCSTVAGPLRRTAPAPWPRCLRCRNLSQPSPRPASPRTSPRTFRSVARTTTACSRRSLAASSTGLLINACLHL